MALRPNPANYSLRKAPSHHQLGLTQITLDVHQSAGGHGFLVLEHGQPSRLLRRPHGPSACSIRCNGCLNEASLPLDRANELEYALETAVKAWTALPGLSGSPTKRTKALSFHRGIIAPASRSVIAAATRSKLA